MIDQYIISFRQGSGKIYAVDIQLRKAPYTRVLSFKIEPRIKHEEFVTPELMSLILFNLNEGKLTIPCLNK